MLRRAFLSLFAALPFAGLFRAPKPADPGKPYDGPVDLNAIVEKSRQRGLTTADIDEFVEWNWADLNGTGLMTHDKPC